MADDDLEYKFALLETSSAGHLSVVEDKRPGDIFHPLTLFPAGLPRVFSPLVEEVTEKFLGDPERLGIHDFRNSQRFWDREVDVESLYSFNVCPLNTSIEVERNPTTGELLGFYEEQNDSSVKNGTRTAKNSCSMHRAPGPPSEATRGSSTNYPFWPGGMEQTAVEKMLEDDSLNIGMEGDLLTCPPGFEKGVDFGKSTGTGKAPNSLNISDLIYGEDDTINEWILQENSITDNQREENLEEEDGRPLARSASLENMLTNQKDDIPKLQMNEREAREIWAEEIDINKPMNNFHKIVPNMAHKYPFELDQFQKQAVVCLENHQSVFVAAHTSAGKTVVAEYAIALSKKHMTRVIYTSPIKALSNQKYRDFKTTFQDVGLLTGDVQLHPEAFCLIMTTEILRSMLYNGSEVIRDLEWVIFDEVHYINDAERGVVWEEVLIMLPEHCNVILLSATVPNTLEFANWVGRTKKKRIFVISTLKRPVPLEHFLYTGNSNKTSNEMFLLLDHSRKFHMTAHNKAVDAKKDRMSKHQKSFGAKSGRGTPGSVTHMAGLLQRGLGVHHSGVLPILKEVIEMLFTRGLVKLLFATETFAMGVNMPARTVIFDSIRKHDGTCMRELLPGEYIQMAGRAGRRGKDTTGSVIILCKGDVPEVSELHRMMLGRPTKLESQFRLTYGMILNLHRVEELRVQDMMKRSFAEFNSRKDSKEQEQKLKELLFKLDEKQDTANIIQETDFGQYYESCSELLELRRKLQLELFLSTAGLRSLQPGRVLVVSNETYKQCLAVSLKIDTTGKTPKFLVLVMTERQEFTPKDDLHPFAPEQILLKTLFRPEVKADQDIIFVEAKDISYITTTKIDIKADRIIDDHNKRQIPRFQHDPPSQSTCLATQQLLRLVEKHPHGMPSLDPRKDFDVKRLDLVEDLLRISFLEQTIQTGYSCVDSPRFKTLMTEVEEYMKLKGESMKLRYLLSDDSLHLLPEYKNSVQVLKELRYIDEREAVQLKGRVACEISNHELVLTELVFENILSPLEPEEIVALLSSAVFQQKVDSSEICLPPNLENGMNKIINVATMIGEVQRQCGIRQAVEDFVSALKFGLTFVVYEWAKGTSFHDITNLTQVQEGVIVRTIQRLHETCRDIKNAARVIGDPGLLQKMEKCSELIKRDIVFAASLYTQ